VWASGPAPLTSLKSIHELTNAEASHALPVDFEATVNFSRGNENLLFVQDGELALFVRPPTADNLQPGDRVRILGKTQSSFRPIAVASSVTFLHHGDRVKPVPATFDQLIRAQLDSQIVSARATVHAADVATRSTTAVLSARLQLLTDGGHFEVNVTTGDTGALGDLLDSEVEITGISAGKFDDKMQQTGVVLYVSSLADIKVLKRASASPWSLPVTPMDQVLAVYHLRDFTPRVRIDGTITYYQPGSAVVLQNGRKSLWVATHTLDPLQIGNRAAVTGFPDAHDRMLTLTDGEVQDSHIFAPVVPQPATWKQLAFWSANRPDGHLYDLVSIEGQVVTEVREASQDEYILSSDGQLFTAIYRHPRATPQLPPMRQVPLGSRIRVTGICIVENSSTINPGEEAPFNILLRSSDDIDVLASPSLLNVRNLIIVVGLLLGVVIVIASRGWTLERKVRRQTATMAAGTEAEAAMERRRSRILEDINGTEPLAGVLEEIVELVSFRLGGSPCWCEITDGARLGNYPADAQALFIVREQITGRSGAALGTILAGLCAGSALTTHHPEAISMGARLAALAIETRRLYSDLLHRSEFDLLTDIHNRFSMERQLDTLIEEAREKAGIFGLIYLDLDEFKKVNDLWGHHIGDLYLREVTVRMKRQLRARDMLARLGGDEFAVLLPVVRNRAEVEDIAVRLERCFDDPIGAEGLALQGSASFGIALYPEDGASRDSVLNAADAAMYRAKDAKRQAGKISASQVA
jgi:diguanylate cyclase (GGDEF)-like protein